jgi:N-acetylneuraminate synthase/N,N'-diacetyllegionaminate synthase
VAEVGVNHNGDFQLAKRLVDASVEAGADAVKFQTFKAERVASSTACKADYQIEATGSAESQVEMLRRLELGPEAHQELERYCRARGIMFLSTPFDEESVDLLEGLGVPAFKVGSGEITNLIFLRYIALRGKPVILSTGMASLDEVQDAVRALRDAGCERIVLLHCVSSYPADPAEANLRAMGTMAAALQVPVGFSDHTTGLEVAIAAVALGACLIEKHITLDTSLPGPDHHASLNPEVFGRLCRALRMVEQALGDGIKRPTAGEANVARVARRSLHAARALQKGQLLKAADLAARRPGTGIPVGRWESVIGRRLTRSVRAGTMLAEEDLR